MTERKTHSAKVDTAAPMSVASVCDEKLREEAKFERECQREMWADLELVCRYAFPYVRDTSNSRSGSGSSRMDLSDEKKRGDGDSEEIALPSDASDDLRRLVCEIAVPRSFYRAHRHPCQMSSVSPQSAHARRCHGTSGGLTDRAADFWRAVRVVLRFGLPMHRHVDPWDLPKLAARRRRWHTRLHVPAVPESCALAGPTELAYALSLEVPDDWFPAYLDRATATTTPTFALAEHKASERDAADRSANALDRFPLASGQFVHADTPQQQEPWRDTFWKHLETVASAHLPFRRRSASRGPLDPRALDAPLFISPNLKRLIVALDVDADFYEPRRHAERLALVNERRNHPVEPSIYGENGDYGTFWRAIRIAAHYDLPMERVDPWALSGTPVARHYRDDRRGMMLQAPGSASAAELVYAYTLDMANVDYPHDNRWAYDIDPRFALDATLWRKMESGEPVSAHSTPSPHLGLTPDILCNLITGPTMPVNAKFSTPSC